MLPGPFAVASPVADWVVGASVFVAFVPSFSVVRFAAQSVPTPMAANTIATVKYPDMELLDFAKFIVILQTSSVLISDIKSTAT
jgi:hypothetical protein